MRIGPLGILAAHRLILRAPGLVEWTDLCDSFSPR